MKTKKLKLSRERLRSLNPVEMQHVGGASAACVAQSQACGTVLAPLTPAIITDPVPWRPVGRG